MITAFVKTTTKIKDTIQKKAVQAYERTQIGVSRVVSDG